MAVVREFVEANVAHDDQVIADLGLDVTNGLVQDAFRVQRGGALRVTYRGHAEQHDAADAQPPHASAAARFRDSVVCWTTPPGMELMGGLGSVSPSRMNAGRIRSAGADGSRR